MEKWRRCRSIAMVFVVASLAFPFPIAWAQTESIEQRIDFNDPVIEAGIERIPDPEERAIARELHGQCKEDRAMADAVTREAEALAGADGLTREMIGGTIEALQGQGDAKVQAAVDALTGLSTSLNQPGVTLVDVQEKLASIGPILAELEAFKEGMPSSAEISKAKEFWGGMESDPVNHALEAHFRDEMEKFLESGGSLSLEAMKELGEQMLAAGINPLEVVPMGAGHEFGPGNMPSLEQMQAMGMSAEQIQMAQEHMQQGGTMPEGMMPEGFGPGPGQEYQGMSPMEAFEQYAAEHQLSPEMETQYREMAETYQREFENQNYDTTQSTNFDTYQPAPGGGGSGETLVRTEIHVADHNADGDTTDPVDTHPHEIYRHADGTCHDHSDQSPEPC